MKHLFISLHRPAGNGNNRLFASKINRLQQLMRKENVLIMKNYYLLNKNYLYNQF
ncbi:hypothetical protein l11_01940 [Neisseria weaveri LMG 5135]|nr:hypothetical protein l13_11040 [Neisseria weaveri ATCC 51223]EGV38747.1 hypothetical protein l11_01940 [Neisseria weaveri LMG 5135]